MATVISAALRSSATVQMPKKNPDYIPDDPNDHDERSGYNFVLKVPQTSDFNTFKLEIFDPDCYNAGNPDRNLRWSARRRISCPRRQQSKLPTDYYALSLVGR